MGLSHLLDELEFVNAPTTFRDDLPLRELAVIMRSTRSLLVTAALIVLVVSCSQNSPIDLVEEATTQSVEDRFIVVLQEHAAPPGHAARHARAAQIANEYGVGMRHTYGTAIFGFSGTVPAGRLNALRRDPRVAWVEKEEIHHTLVQTIPTGIDRIEVDKNPTVTTDGIGETFVDLDVAVIDTGILASHPDLNVAGGRNFANGGPSNWSDGNGHGTHVAGTIGAKNNGSGVVGVAPGARLWSVRVCGNSGFCMSGDIVAGIDWVAQQKRTDVPNFAAANFSISSADSDRSCDNPANATHKTICGLVDTGVVFVMAAGNEGREKVPYPVAFSVSAIADFDGLPGGMAAPTCRTDQDDTLANFSNYGPVVDIAAPGVCILSTWNDGGYRTISGTSMAAPHVTGAVALYIHANGANGMEVPNGGAGAASIKSAIIGAALPQSTAFANPCSYDDSRIGGPLLFVNGEAFGGDGSCGDVTDGGAGEEEDTTVDKVAPTASFSYKCSNSSTCTFTDTSTAGTSAILDWDWTFEKAEPPLSNEQHPIATFQESNTPTHEVTLVVTSGEGLASAPAVSQITCSVHRVHGLRCN